MGISVSLGNFWYWGKFNFEVQIKYADLLSPLDVDGFEFHLTNEEILQEKMLSFKNSDGKLLTAHLPKNFSEANIGKLYALKDFGVKYFVIHADLYNEKTFPESIPFLIENSDKKKSFGEDVREIIAFNREICFDVNHSIETMGKEEAQKQYYLAEDKIRELHVSANIGKRKYEGIDTPHYLYADSSEKIPAYLNRDLIWVIEGVVPPKRLDLIEAEIKLIKELKK